MHSYSKGARGLSV